MKRLTLIALVLSLYLTCLVLGQRHQDLKPPQVNSETEDPNDPNEVVDPNVPVDPGE